MSEIVETGGVMRFEYQKGNQSRLSDKEKREIEEAYKKAEERRKKEKLRKNIIIGGLIVLFLIILVILIIRYLL